MMEARRWYTHTMTGDRGYLVQQDGEDCIRYDQPGHERIVRLRTEQWVVDSDHRPLNLGQLAQVAYAADQKLCWALGLYAQLKSWLDLNEEQRASWVRGEGPKGHPARIALFASVWSTLKELAR
jgi:hypothetical protein